jgi:hypothetical protein
MHFICQVPCRFGVLKRGALSHTFVGKLRIVVNLFTPIAEALTWSESFQSFIQQKRNCSASSRWAAKGLDWNECLCQGRLVRVLNTTGPFRKRARLQPTQNVCELLRLFTDQPSEVFVFAPDVLVLKIQFIQRAVGTTVSRFVLPRIESRVCKGTLHRQATRARNTSRPRRLLSSP